MSVVLWCPCATGESGLYDNPARQKQRERPQRAGEDEDIYGGVGEGEEGVYDTVGGGRTMKLSEDGIYDNPHAKGEYVHTYVCMYVCDASHAYSALNPMVVWSCCVPHTFAPVMFASPVFFLPCYSVQGRTVPMTTLA